MEFFHSGSNSNSELLSDCESAESDASEQAEVDNEDDKTPTEPIEIQDEHCRKETLSSTFSRRIDELKRVCSEAADARDEDDEIDDILLVPEKKRAKQSILSFFTSDKDKDTVEDTSCSHVVKETLKTSGSNSTCLKRNYSKYQGVCLLCARSQNLQAKEKAVLARSSEYHIKRHKNSSHKKISLAVVKANIVPTDHTSVPKSIREKMSGPVEASTLPAVVTQINKVTTPAPEGTPRNDMLRLDYDGDGNDDSDDHEVESSRTQSMTTKAATLQTDLTNFVSVEKPSFEETVFSMLKKLDNKIDNLKESRSTTAGNSENHYML